MEKQKRTLQATENFENENKTGGKDQMYVVCIMGGLLAIVLCIALFCVFFPKHTDSLLARVNEQMLTKGPCSISDEQLEEIAMSRNMSIYLAQEYRRDVDDIIYMVHRNVELARRINANWPKTDAEYHPVAMGNSLIFMRDGADLYNPNRCDFQSFDDWLLYELAMEDISSPTPVQPLATDARTGQPISSEPAGEWAGPTD